MDGCPSGSPAHQSELCPLPSSLNGRFAPLNRGDPTVPRKVMSLSSGSKGPIMCRIRRIRSPGWEGPGKLITAWLDRSTRMATAPKRRMRDA